MLRIAKAGMTFHVLALVAALALTLGAGLAVGEETTDQHPGATPMSREASAETGQAVERGNSGCEADLSAIDLPLIDLRSPPQETGGLCPDELPEIGGPVLADPVFMGPPLRRYCRCSCGAIQCQSSADCGGAPCQTSITCC